MVLPPDVTSTHKVGVVHSVDTRGGVVGAWKLTNTSRSTPTQDTGEALPGVISGVVTVLGDPAVQKVRVYRRSDGALVGETTSAADGTYQVTGLDPAEQHYVVALHGTLEYNAVVADNIVPEETS